MHTVYTLKEQAEHRQLWIDALRGGQYEQRQYRMRVGNSYDCLGAACDISRLGVWVLDYGCNEKHINPMYYVVNGEVCASFLPKAVIHWLGVESPYVRLHLAYRVKTEDTKCDRSKRVDTLSAANDVGATFYEIANMIEKCYIVTANYDVGVV